MAIKSNSKKNNKKLGRNFLKWLAISSIASGIIIILVFFIRISNSFLLASHSRSPDLSITANIGSFIGGVVGTLFSLAGVTMLFLTLRDQRESFQRERFEQRFFELLKFLTNDVAEFEIAGAIKGRLCFKYMINELRYIYRIVEVGAIQYMLANNDSKVKNNRDYLKMAYLIMFFGIGYSSERQLKDLFNTDELKIFEQYVKTFLEGVQEEYHRRDPMGYGSKYFTASLPISGVPDGFTFETFFYPFDGHTSRLGHYFRMLFQIAKYIDGQSVYLLSQDEKYEYAKNLRATLSNNEQLLLFYNSISVLGSEWITQGLIKEYALIKNIPLGVVDIGVHPHDVFGKFTDDGRYLFETDEIQKMDAR